MRYITTVFKWVGPMRFSSEPQFMRPASMQSFSCIFKCSTRQPAAGRIAAHSNRDSCTVSDSSAWVTNFRRGVVRGKSILWGQKSKFGGRLETQQYMVFKIVWFWLKTFRFPMHFLSHLIACYTHIGWLLSMFPALTVLLERPLWSQQQKQNSQTHQEDREDFPLLLSNFQYSPPKP